MLKLLDGWSCDAVTCAMAVAWSRRLLILGRIRGVWTTMLSTSWHHSLPDWPACPSAPACFRHHWNRVESPPFRGSPGCMDQSDAVNYAVRSPRSTYLRNCSRPSLKTSCDFDKNISEFYTRARVRVKMAPLKFASAVIMFVCDRLMSDRSCVAEQFSASFDTIDLCSSWSHFPLPVIKPLSGCIFRRCRTLYSVRELWNGRRVCLSVCLSHVRSINQSIFQ